MLYWRIYQAARKRINKSKTETSVVDKNKSPEARKRFSAAKFRFKNRNKLPVEDWDSSQNSEAVSNFLIPPNLHSMAVSQKASMRSSTKSESNGNNSDNMNNNTIEGSAEDVIDVISTECSSKLLNQAGNYESELTQRAEHVDNDNSAKINVYEQVIT